MCLSPICLQSFHVRVLELPACAFAASLIMMFRLLHCGRLAALCEHPHAEGASFYRGSVITSTACPPTCRETEVLAQLRAARQSFMIRYESWPAAQWRLRKPRFSIPMCGSSRPVAQSTSELVVLICFRWLTVGWFRCIVCVTWFQMTLPPRRGRVTCSFHDCDLCALQHALEVFSAWPLRHHSGRWH